MTLLPLKQNGTFGIGDLVNPNLKLITSARAAEAGNLNWTREGNLLVEVGLGLLALDGGAERLQVPSRVWHRVVCLRRRRRRVSE